MIFAECKFSRAFFLLVTVLAGIALAQDPAAGSGVRKFREKFSLRFLCDYNFVAIWNSAFGSDALSSNRPVNVGAGLGYDDLFTLFGTSWDVSWDFKFAIPFTTSDDRSDTQGFETGLDFFPGSWWHSFKFRMYSGFTTDLEDEEGNRQERKFVDLSIMDIYYSFLWMATARGEFSPRSAYFLDRRQGESAGSLILGGRLQWNSAEDPDDLLAYYERRRALSTVWVDMGYTYTWVFGNGFFGNVWGVVGLACGRENASDGYAVLPETDFKTAWGYIGEKWSWNVVLKAGYSAVAYSSHWEQKLVAAFEMLVVRRF